MLPYLYPYLDFYPYLNLYPYLDLHPHPDLHPLTLNFPGSWSLTWVSAQLWLWPFLDFGLDPRHILRHWSFFNLFLYYYIKFCLDLSLILILLWFLPPTCALYKTWLWPFLDLNIDQGQYLDLDFTSNLTLIFPLS